MGIFLDYWLEGRVPGVEDFGKGLLEGSWEHGAQEI